MSQGKSHTVSSGIVGLCALILILLAYGWYQSMGQRDEEQKYAEQLRAQTARRGEKPRVAASQADNSESQSKKEEPNEIAIGEIEVGAILWKSHTNAEKYFGTPTRVVPPRARVEGWLYEYKNGNATVGSKSKAFMVVYRYKKRPRNWKEALFKVGLPVEAGPPVNFFGMSHIWSSAGTMEHRPIVLNGRTLTRVILSNDFTEISIDACQEGVC